MQVASIRKNTGALAVQPNLLHYEQVRDGFSWEALRLELAAASVPHAMNMAYQAVDRHAAGPLGNRPALRWLSPDGTSRDFSYRLLQEQSNRFASILQQFAVGKGETVASLTGRIPELFIAALGTLKNLNIVCPLFAAFGPEAVWQRLQSGNARVLVTTERLYREKVEGLRPRLPGLQQILLTDARDHRADGVWSLSLLMAQASADFAIPPTDPRDLALLHFTSGTTGMPKGALHVHEALLIHYSTGRYVLDLHPQDMFWCTADPGWVTGISYGILAPLLCGVTSIVDAGEFDARRWFRILEEQRVGVWYTSPSAIRRLMRLGTAPRREYDLENLRLVCSVGEPLHADAVLWGVEALGVPVHDTWWQTETGGIMIANYPAVDIRPGSMGRPLPGIEAGVVRRCGEGRVEVQAGTSAIGELALRAGWPSMFCGYLHRQEQYRHCFADGWYLTGDLVMRDGDGYFWFTGRADDVIKTAGHMVSPFEVESTLLQHPAIAEAGVIGKPDSLSGELVKAYVSLKDGYIGDDALALELIAFARSRLGPAIAPREIAFAADLPKNNAGKILRRVLRERETGSPEGGAAKPQGGEGRA